LQAIGANSIDAFGWNVSLVGASRALLYLFGLAGEIFV
jgi:YihY family inner membrane protein